MNKSNYTSKVIKIIKLPKSGTFEQLFIQESQVSGMGLVRERKQRCGKTLPGALTCQAANTCFPIRNMILNMRKDIDLEVYLCIYLFNFSLLKKANYALTTI